MTETDQGTGIIILILIAYFIPWFIAIIRKHKNTTPIFLVNLLLGWAFIGWVVALVWSTTSNTSNTLNKIKY
jgi:hypothetical protein